MGRQETGNNLRSQPFGLILAVIASVYWVSSTARAQNALTAGRAVDFRKNGIKFQIKASIKAKPGSLYTDHDDDRTSISLALKLRISAHATESNYFGEVSGTFSSFRPNTRSEEKLFWQDARCHQRRGLPKTTVTAIDGSIDNERVKTSIAARPRHLGLLLPSDEITAGMRLPDGADNAGQFIAYRSRTKASHLFVDVKVYLIDCDLAQD